MNRVYKFFLAVVLAVALLPASAEILPMASDLQRDGVASKRGGMPIMVFYMSTSCSYCDEVKDLYLEPMVSSGQYNGRLIIRMVDTEGTEYLRDFGGKRMDFRPLYWAVRPPSMTNSEPVTKDDSSEAR